MEIFRKKFFYHTHEARNQLDIYSVNEVMFKVLEYANSEGFDGRKVIRMDNYRDPETQYYVIDVHSFASENRNQEEIKEKEEYIAKLEAQISRDRESLIKEGEKSEVLKKYLGNQQEWINE